MWNFLINGLQRSTLVDFVDLGTFFKASSFSLKELEAEFTNMMAKKESFNMVHAYSLKTLHYTTTKGYGSIFNTIMKNIPDTYFWISVTV